MWGRGPAQRKQSLKKKKKFGWHFGNYIFPFPLSPAKLIGNVLTNNILLHCKHTKTQNLVIGVAIFTFICLLVQLHANVTLIGAAKHQA